MADYTGFKACGMLTWLRYSWRSDSIGSILAARYAGYIPNVIPIAALIPNAIINEAEVMIVGIPAKYVTNVGMIEPRMMPITPPTSVSSKVSERN